MVEVSLFKPCERATEFPAARRRKARCRERSHDPVVVPGDSFGVVRAEKVARAELPSVLLEFRNP
jgi:hypothetical protein